MKQPWHILGAGAIGSLWACHLTDLGFPVSLILRNQTKVNLFQQQNSIVLAGQHYPMTAELASAPETIKQLLITTKSVDTENAFKSIKSRLDPHAKIIVLQNGMGSQQWIQSQCPHADVVWASTTDGAWLKTPFNVQHAGRGVTQIGAPNQTYTWVDDLIKGGFLNVVQDKNIALTLWRKLAINCAINPLTAIFDCKNGELINNPDYLSTMAAICREVELVAHAFDIDLFDGPLIEQACHVAGITAENYSSMLQDVRQGRQTEIDSITGYLCRQAKARSIPVPINLAYLKKVQKVHR
ncbi:2-dehydropantoate 2-reductase [Neptuniibacter sp. 1_MG-2023]|uniref:2-dehydropantoate 2-reductase n=1 Tax=Neptuniibacter sp. 1_MG-2023 TaxID=3062662 RepID=UPI0026E22150|nr:2-dehydropantoate 2-reductase [Neptuniibacter sp. 1_MG-2023]MDO6592685.1 2-dehydropantoate 2-reductase [Neptuniibacter sp. 1_MG-2023]